MSKLEKIFSAPSILLDKSIDASINFIKSRLIIISVETALHTAKEMNSVVESEIYLYIVHGLLHLMGYDDKTGKLADIMHGEEKRILSDFGFEVNFNT